MGDTNREAFLNNPAIVSVEQSDHDRVIPAYLVAEAGKEESWEKKLKDELEVSSFGREFAKKFLNSFKTENKQMVATWEPDKAASWLGDKVKTEDGGIDRDRVSQILDAAGAIDEKRTEVLALLTEGKEPSKKKDEGSPTKGFGDVELPPTADRANLERAEENLKGLNKRKTVGSYGLILTDDHCFLYKKGVKLAECSVEACGGFDVLASEVEAMQTNEDVETFFDLHDDASIISKAWLRPRTATPIFDDPGFQRNDQQKADTNSFDPNMVDQVNPSGGPDAGPASVVPGARTRIAPGIPDGTGESASITT